MTIKFDSFKDLHDHFVDVCNQFGFDVKVIPKEPPSTNASKKEMEAHSKRKDKNGNPRTTIYIDAIQNGKNVLAKDFISKKQGWKLKNLAKSSGDDNLSNKIEKKENVIYSDVVGLVFNFIVKLNGTYANVGKYVPRSAEDIVKNSSKKPEEFNDDIPF